MKFFRLLYNSFIWGILAAAIAFQSEWLEMRMNIGLIIPIVMVVYILVSIIIRKIPDLKGTIINITVSIVILLAVLGKDRIQVVPASIIREGIKMTRIPFGTVNMTLLFIVIVGLAIITFAEKHKS